MSNPRTVTHLDADLLDGMDSSQLRARTYRYSFPSSATSVLELTFPGLPAGSYLATFSGYGDVTTPTTSGGCCFISTTDNTKFAVVSDGVAAGGEMTVNGSGVVDTRTLDRLRCFVTAGTWSPKVPSEVTFTPIAAVSSSVATSQ